AGVAIPLDEVRVLRHPEDRDRQSSRIAAGLGHELLEIRQELDHVAVLAPPTITGGCGFWAGFGHVIIGGNLTNSPLYSGFDLVQIARIASTRSRITLKRDLKSVPWSNISSAFQPAPMPNRNRPPET